MQWKCLTSGTHKKEREEARSRAKTGRLGNRRAPAKKRFSDGSDHGHFHDTLTVHSFPLSFCHHIATSARAARVVLSSVLFRRILAFVRVPACIPDHPDGQSFLFSFTAVHHYSTLLLFRCNSRLARRLACFHLISSFCRLCLRYRKMARLCF